MTDNRWAIVAEKPRMFAPGWTYGMFETVPMIEIDRLYPSALVMLDHQDPLLLAELEAGRARFISEAWSYAHEPGSHRLRVSFPIEPGKPRSGSCLRWLPWSHGSPSVASGMVDFPGVWVRYSVSPAGCGNKRPPRMFEAELARVCAWANGWLRAHGSPLECVPFPWSGGGFEGGRYSDPGELVFRHPERPGFYAAQYRGDELVRIPEFLRRINDWDWCKSHNL